MAVRHVRLSGERSDLFCFHTRIEDPADRDAPVISLRIYKDL